MDHTLQNSFSSRKKIFITGIAGFIGFHLARYLKSKGDIVLGCDNFNDYYDPKLKYDRSQILKNEGIEVHTADIRDKDTIESLFQGAGITHIVHLAAQAGVRYCITHPQAYVHSNLDGFVQMLEVCRKFGSIPFIYASSSSVYGMNKKIPFAENDPTDAPSNFYGATKKSNELIARSYHHLYHIPVTGLRFFTVYGPWGRPDMAYFSFTKAVLDDTPIPLFAEGKMQRDFTYIDDIIRGSYAAINLAAKDEIFNLGHNNPHPVNELVSQIESSANKKAIIQHFPMQPGEVPITYADITKGQNMLGFSPETPLSQGISKFVQWYKEYYNCKT
jgi:UDP-glucuronate 4-epimerase